jgi:hypothetical protein
MHGEEENDRDVTHMHANPKLKSITIKLSIQIKFKLHHYFFIIKSSKQDHTCLYLHDIF